MSDEFHSALIDEFHSATIKLIDDLIDISRLSPNGKGADDTDAIYELVHIITDDGGVPLPPPAEMTFGLAYALAVAIRRLAVM